MHDNIRKSKKEIFELSIPASTSVFFGCPWPGSQILIWKLTMFWIVATDRVIWCAFQICDMRGQKVQDLLTHKEQWALTWHLRKCFPVCIPRVDQTHPCQPFPSLAIQSIHRKLLHCHILPYWMESKNWKKNRKGVNCLIKPCHISFSLIIYLPQHNIEDNVLVVVRDLLKIPCSFKVKESHYFINILKIK